MTFSFGDIVTEELQKWGYDSTILKGETQTPYKKRRLLTMSVLHITTATFENEVLHSDKPVLLDFWASWCGPCRMVGPILDEIAAERSDIKVCKINVDEQPALAAQFGVMSIPTLVVVKNGQEVNRSVGAMPKARILALL